MKLEDLEPLVGDWTTTATLPGGDGAGERSHELRVAGAEAAT